ncbi:hypothetical protein [Halomonas elongata]|uniref:Uncharacterized protein n=1 Tax=Halomonas elongata (strain ATCC 33173 / DSM 2581 / NBRC 15536 / NCIMB 2198 / 1H9) TaxID=768066 RepID=E1VA62_HALED|nr:hypothetical protein [Halomonas elongata]WBF17692.1 hypothetical protein LM502_16695 [Halomonas elongata]WPU46533.1 hypothetical protein SR933_14930 [Halomonas elongata DSM 2581]CBV43950.1 uncharacterized protein HELO_4066 [Halomonas elongata DSM 2581]
MTGSRATSRTRLAEVMREAMVFASQADDPGAFLQAWLEGDWPRLRQEWPEYDMPRDLEAGKLDSGAQDIVEEAFVAGLTAFERGDATATNPYPANSTRHQAWSSGWTLAQQLHDYG